MPERGEKRTQHWHTYRGRVNHASFTGAGFDAVGIADAGYPFYHTLRDSAVHLNFGLVRRGTQLMLAAVAELAGGVGQVAGAVATAAAVPSSFSLAQNYPNPFNPSTTIKYELPKSSDVRLSVYDMLGREVSVLVNERRDAGVHEVKFDGSNLASGVYVYRLQAGDVTQTKRLMLLR
jgi:hypothetical protein